MDQDRHEYKKGLLYFCCLAFCFCAFFTTPDGDTLFYKLIGLFGISPGISVGVGSTLYIYMLLPLIGGIISIKRIFKYWWHYGQRFASYNFFLRKAPFFVFALGFLLSANLDNIFYAAIGQKSGLQSVVSYDTKKNELNYKFEDNSITYSYDLTFRNLSEDMISFEVKLIDDSNHVRNPLPEILIKDDYGQAKTFTLHPKEFITFDGEVTETIETESYSGSGSRSKPKVVLIHGNEQHTPMMLKKEPIN